MLQVTFEGETTFGFEEWSGPLFAISGTSITITGASGSTLNGQGAMYWDGEGSDGGVTKPKFFQAHDLISSTITDINILNPPVQVFSIDDCSDLTITGVTIDASAGDTGSLGANTDGFDIGSSTTVLITGATVKNQDDCVAINSGTVSYLPRRYPQLALSDSYAGHHLHRRRLLRRPRPLHRLHRWPRR